MVQSLTDRWQVIPDSFSETGALDPILGIDTRLFIDPSLLRINTVPELQGSYARVTAHFNAVLDVVKGIQQKGDRLWRAADKMLTFPEVKGLCIGYSSQGTSGSGMGPGLREQLLNTITEIDAAGVLNPALFELVGIFEENVGPDRISDMIAKIIAPDLVRFSQRVCRDTGMPVKRFRIPVLEVEEDLPFDPDKNEPVMLVPRSILKDLPVAESFGDVRWIAEHNEALRDELNNLIGSSWKQRVTVGEQKRALRDFFIRDPSILQRIIEAYLRTEATQYDFEDDRAGEVSWYRAAKKVAAAAPLHLQLPPEPTADQVQEVVMHICEHFQHLIEDNQLCRLLYDKSGSRKHESAAQLLFFGIADAYCRANNLDLSPESDGGRGPVDFKVSRGFKGKVLVEVKLSSNGQLVHGFEKQLPAYARAEGTQPGVYLVVDNGGATERRVARFWAIVAGAEGPAPRVIWVDGIPRRSASKA